MSPPPDQDLLEALASSITHSPELVGVADDGATMSFLNDAGRGLLGLGPFDPLPALAALFTPESARLVTGTALPAIAREGSWFGEVSLASSPPEPVDLLLRRLPTRANGRSGIFVHTRRNAARRRAFEALATAESRFRRLIDQLSVGVIVQAPDSTILTSNAAARRLLGLDEERITGLSSRDRSWDVVREDGTPFAAEDRPVLTVMRTGQPVRNTVMGIAIPGSAERRWLLVDAQPEYDADGRIADVVAVLVDITDRKALERQVSQAQKMEAIARLAGGIAHDFNNSIAAILSLADFAIEAVPEGGRAREDLGELVETARRAANLTRQLLTFSRQNVVQPQAVAVGARAGQVMRMLGRLLGAWISVTTKFEEGAWRVFIDPGQLEQVLVNLVLNARDAMPRGGALEVRAEARTLAAGDVPGLAAGDFVVLSVRDEGSGIDERTRAHLFEPFFTTKPEGIGTGLGLATAHGIVQRAGGTITVDSTPGRGSEFSVFLPRYVAPAAIAERGAAVAAADAPGATILLVEDDALLRVVLSRALRARGYAVLESGAAEDARELARTHQGPIDALVTDVGLPAADGWVCARWIREARPDVRVLFMSGFTAGVALPDGSTAKPTHFLAKPFTPAELANRLRGVLDAPPAPLESVA